MADDNDNLPGNNITIRLSPLRIVGSKKRLIQKHNLMDYFPACKVFKHYSESAGTRVSNRRVYVELFCGSAIMFFNLAPTPLFSILNDVDHNIFNFWNVIKNKYDDFIKELEFTWCGHDWINTFAGRTDDIGRAIYFYIKNRYSNIIKIPGRFPKEIQFRDWKAIMDKSRLQIWNYDFKTALIHLNKMLFKPDDNCMEFLMFQDPPYYGTESFYKKKFTTQDHETLSKLNHDSSHHIILTYNDDPFIRELYKDWHIIELDNYTTFKWQYNKELLLSNKPLQRKQQITEGKLF